MKHVIHLLEPATIFSADTYRSNETANTMSQAVRKGCSACKEPCEKTSYDPSLSYAALSSLNVRKVMDTSKFNDVRNNYESARGVEQRLTGTSFSEDLTNLDAIKQTYTEVK